ncbi:MAG: GAF domain-containing protein [Pseudolabrys sp.]
MTKRGPAAGKTQTPRKRAGASDDAKGQIAALQRELAEAREREASTAEILRSIASTPKEAQRALDDICETAVRLFGASSVGIRRVEGNVLRAVAWAGPATTANILANRDVPIESHPAALAIVQRRQFARDDIANPSGDEELAEAATETSRIAVATGARSVAGTPLMQEGEAIGVLSVLRNEVRPFTPNELESMRGFADQAVIAIENTRLLTELRESLDRQTATAEVLRTIASAPAEVERALDTIAKVAARLFGASDVNIMRLEGGVLRHAATLGELASAVETAFPDRPLDSSSMPATAILERRPLHIADLSAPDVRARFPTARLPKKPGSVVAAPLMREGEAIGAIVLVRDAVRPFTEMELAQVQNFADQAVIAIENARLLNELRQRTEDLTESLHQQTATAEVLSVMSRSKFDLLPILQSVVDTAIRLCRADEAVISRLEDGLYRFAAGNSLSPEYPEIERANPIAPGPDTLVGRTATSRAAVRIEDAATEPGYALKEQIAVGGLHSMLGVPLLRDGEPIGVIALARRRVEPYSDR